MLEEDHDWKSIFKEAWARSRNKADSNLAVVKVTTEGDVTNQLWPVHQICEKSGEGEEG